MEQKGYFSYNMQLTCLYASFQLYNLVLNAAHVMAIAQCDISIVRDTALIDVRTWEKSH